MSVPNEKQVFLEIIEKYKNMPILWDREHEDYKCAPKRNIANKILLEVYKKLDEDATLHTLTKKILNLRTNYFKELRKVKASLEDGDAEMYEPKLWYFDAFSFLDDNASNTSECRRHECKINESCHSQRKGSIKTETSSPSSDEEGSCQNSETRSSPPVKIRKFTNPIVYKNTNNHLELAVESSQMKNDECEIIGKAIGLQLRDLGNKQLTIAQKIISDTIYYAKFGLLSQKTFIKLESPPP